MVGLTWRFGRRICSPSVGLVAAALLAFAPESILWGGRVRMYAPLQFFVLLATVAFYRWIVEGQDRPAERWLFVLAYWGALFSHAEAMLLWPIWALWALLQRGWRWCLRLPTLAALVLSGSSIAIEITLRRIGPPVQARVSAGVLVPLERQYLGAALDWPGIQKVVQPLFLTPLYLPLTALVLAGIGYLLLTWLRPRPDSRQVQPLAQRPLLYLYALTLPTLALLLFVVDPEWKSPRYGLMLQPHYFLLGAILLVRLGGWLREWIGSRREPWQTLWGLAATTVVVALIALSSWPLALAAATENVPGYDWAFAYVEEHQQPGEVVITFLCPAAFFHLGRCDYLAIPNDYAGFAFQQDGRWISGWDGVPLLDSGQDLRRALSAAPGAWFVVDEGRFTRRYDPDFVQAVLEEMDLVAAERRMVIFSQRPILEDGQ